MRAGSEGTLPIYQQIKNWILQQVESHAWPENYRLPSEDELARHFQVARGTVKHALDQLEGEGVLYRLHGKGTFVSSGWLDFTMAQRLVSFPELFASRGLRIHTRTLAQAVQDPTPALASLFTLPPGEKVFWTKRLRSQEDAPILLSENRLAYSVCPGIEQYDLEAQTLYSVLEGIYRVRLDWATRRFDAKSAGGELAQLLQLPAGTPVLYLEQMVYTREGRCIEYSEVWLRGDKIRISTVLRR